MKGGERKMITKQGIEDYFIQLLFCRNRKLLRRESRELYDNLLERYEYEWGIVSSVAEDKLSIVNDNFISGLFKQKSS